MMVNNTKILSISFSDIMGEDQYNNILFFSNWKDQSRSIIQILLDDNNIIELQHFCVENNDGDCFYFVDVFQNKTNKIEKKLESIEINQVLSSISCYGSKISNVIFDIVGKEYKYSIAYIIFEFTSSYKILIYFDPFLHNGEFIVNPSEIANRLGSKHKEKLVEIFKY